VCAGARGAGAVATGDGVVESGSTLGARAERKRGVVGVGVSVVTTRCVGHARARDRRTHARACGHTHTHRHTRMDTHA